VLVTGLPAVDDQYLLTLSDVTTQGSYLLTARSSVFIFCLIHFCWISLFPHDVASLQVVCVAQWSSGQRTWNANSAAPVQIVGRATIPLGSNLRQVVYSHCLQKIELSSAQTGVQKGFSAPKWLW